jgi:tetratricopeptide (TPR) repeat protein
MRTVVVLCLALSAGSASAAPTVRLRRDAVAHHAAANRAFRAGQFEQALDHLQAGYDSEPRAEFLVAFAQTYRELGRIDDAIAHSQRYLELAPNGPFASQVRHLIKSLRTSHKPEPEPEPEPEPAKPAQAVLSPPRPVLVSAPPADDAARLRRRDLTLGLVLSAAGVIVGLGVGLGIGLSDGGAAPPTRFGTISFQ